ncbi:hypothetical protein HMPREF0063_12626 [Aeromicrobium marinum DSM 15272]|uniref:Uncharacterized protein n=1 Tax=Aeromicrobium marinum DSM 15272 TaxID=585531 RepID=E2SF17_9ACTN|nr:hypothetical protein [Aeromicrobium marinum]EFQ82261.1 hypothetical protein HMPREF0063_12626 [Aeromicrobium marinum DSM 15272]
MDRPTPYGLLVAIVVLGASSLTLESGWLRLGGFAAVAVLLASVVYQLLGPQPKAPGIPPADEPTAEGAP